MLKPFPVLFTAKSKNIKKKNNAAKKAELNQKVPMASDMDAFKDLSSSTTSTTSTAYASPATTPDTTVAPPLPPTVVEAVNVAPVPSKTSVVEKSSTENHVDLVRKEISPPPVVTAAAEPEVIVSQQQQPEVSNNNHVGIEASESTAVNHDEVEDEKVSENLSSKSGSQVKLRYDYKESKLLKNLVFNPFSTSTAVSLIANNDKAAVNGGQSNL